MDEEMNSRRALCIDKEITHEAMDIVYSIMNWNEEDKDIPINEREPIYLYIDTPGGDMDVALSICDIIDLSKTPIKIIGMNKVYSAGSLIFAAGQPGYRYLMPNAIVLVHDGYFAFDDSAIKAFSYTKFVISQAKRAYEIFTRNTKPMAYEEWARKARDEWYIYADEAVELGIADHIVEDIEELYM